MMKLVGDDLHRRLGWNWWFSSRYNGDFLLGSCGLKVTVSSRIPFPPIGLEPATYTSEALVAQ
jgi:hypothetical protein